MSAGAAGAAGKGGSGEGAGLGWAAWLVPSLADVVFVALLGFALAIKAHQLTNSDGDLARHLAVGRQILDSGAIPTVDLFSHTRLGAPFVPYEWLSEVLFALIHRGLGLEGVVALSATLAALPFLLLTRWLIRDGANPFVVLLLVTVGALASSMHWLARPHLFTLLLALLWARSLARHRATGSLRYLVPLPFLMALWANLHGGFLVGFVMLGIYFLAAANDRLSASSDRGSTSSSPISRYTSLLTGRRIVALACTGVASLIAVGANPVGYAVLPHLLGYFRLSLLVNNTMEYLSPNFHEAGPQLFLALVLVSMVSLAALPRRVDTAGLGMLLVWTSLSLFSVRNIPIYVVTCLPIVAQLATQAMKRPRPDPLFQREGNGESHTSRGENRGERGGRPGLAERMAATDRQLGRPLLPALSTLLALLICMGAIGNVRPRAVFDPAIFPVAAMSHVDELGVRGNLFNLFTWGGYIIYAGYPNHRVFIDGQTDFYGEDLTRDYLKVARLEPDWETVLDRYQIGWVLFPHQSPLTLLLARTPGWTPAYQDGTADIFVRSREGN